MKLVADAVWAKLTGVFAKNVLHAQVRTNSITCTKPVCILHPLQLSMELAFSSQALLWWLQHVWSFAQHLAAGKGKGKRQLDCAGVVSTVLSTCQLLAACHGQSDLAQLHFQVGCKHLVQVQVCYQDLIWPGGLTAAVDSSLFAAGAQTAWFELSSAAVTAMSCCRVGRRCLRTTAGSTCRLMAGGRAPVRSPQTMCPSEPWQWKRQPGTGGYTAAAMQYSALPRSALPATSC